MPTPPGKSATPSIAHLASEMLDSLRSPDGIMLVNSDGTVQAINRAALDWLGSTAAEVVGQPLGRFLAERLARGWGRGQEAALITLAGEHVPVIVNASAALDARGQSISVVRLVRAVDLTHRLTPAAEANALRTIAEALNRAAGLQEVLDRALETVMPLIGSEAGWVVLLEPLGETRLAAARSLPPALEADNRAAMRGTCQCLDLLRQGHLKAATNIVECERLRAARGDTRGLRHHASVPIRAGGRDASTGSARSLGNLNLTTPADRVFTEAEPNLLTAVGNQIGVAVERARLHEQVKAQRIEEQAALLKLSQALLGETEAQAVMDVAVRAAADALKADFVALGLFDEAAQTVSVQAAVQLPPEVLQQLQRLPLASTPAFAHAIHTRAPVIIQNAPGQSTFAAPPWVVQMGIASTLMAPLIVADGAIGGLMVNSRAPRDWSDDEVRLLSLIANTTAQAFERARLFQAEREQRELAEALRDAATALSATLDFDTMLDHLLEQIAQVVPYDAANVMLLDPPQAGGRGARIRVARQRGYEQFGEQVVRDIVALSFDIAATVNLQRMVESRQPLIIPDTAADPGWVKVEASAHVRSWAGAPIVVAGQVIAFFSLDKIEPNFYRPEHGERLAAFAGQAALALQNARLFEETGRRVQELALLYDAGLTLNRVIEPRTQLEFLLKLAATALRADAAEFFVVDPARDELRYEFGIGLSAEAVEGLRGLRFAAADENTVPGWVATNRLLLNLPDTSADPRWVAVTDDPAFHSALFVPVAYEEQLRGILGVTSKSGDAFTPQDERLLTLFANQVSVAMNNARLFEETRHRAEELEALSQVSATLRKAQTREAMLPLLVEKAMQVLQADAGVLILLEEGALVFAAARGPTETLLGRRHPPGDDPLWQVARTGEPMFIPDVTEQSEFTRWEVCRALMAGMTACACVPLKTAETTVGLLHLACRSRREATPGEIRLLTSIAEMAGNALHRATLHEQTERDAVELTLAYDTTLEGWTRALELRDRETEGHTRRVTEITMRLAKAMGIGDAELVHIRRGALLHDIGKMGVPDGILLKSGPLADEEWMVMRLHPQLAYDMLAPIAYLRPAVDIPYCHHEKWDGTGYPRGLKGEQIPFAARIFAVADVWDALRSDRPYRKGWPEEKVREYIREQAGKHFDPKVVDVFLNVLKGPDEASLA